MILESPRHNTDYERVTYNLTLHTPSEDVGFKMDIVRSGFKQIAAVICNRVPQGRERSMALTALEDACMYAIAGLARAVEVPDEKDDK